MKSIKEKKKSFIYPKKILFTWTFIPTFGNLKFSVLEILKTRMMSILEMWLLRLLDFSIWYTRKKIVLFVKDYKKFSKLWLCIFHSFTCVFVFSPSAKLVLALAIKWRLQICRHYDWYKTHACWWCFVLHPATLF